MASDESIFLAELARRYNELIVSADCEAPPDVHEIENDLLEDASLCPVTLLQQLEQDADDISQRRLRRGTTIRRRNRRRQSVRKLAELLAIAEVANERLVSSAFEGALSTGRQDSDRFVVGKLLKCLLLITLHARSVTVASEVAVLVESGYSGGAEGRLRALHELVATVMLISNDGTYEVSERYQARAVQEWRAAKRAWARVNDDPVWADKVAVDDEPEGLMGDEYLSYVEDKWGAHISTKEQYGWARPALAPDRSSAKQIYFTDIERAAGMDFFRPEYLRYNNHVHAGPLAAVSHFDFSEEDVPMGAHRRYEPVVGARTCFLIGAASRAALHGVAVETQSWDDMLVAGHVWRSALDAERCFALEMD